MFGIRCPCAANSHLSDHVSGVAQLLQRGAVLQLLLVARPAQRGVHARQPAHEDERVLRRREGVLFELGLVDPPRLGCVRRRVGPAGRRRVVRLVADDVHDLEPARRPACPAVELLLEQDVLGALVAVDERHLPVVALGAHQLPQRLVHGRNARARGDERERRLACERVLGLDVEFDVLEAHLGTDRQRVQVLRDGATVVPLDEQVKLAQDAVVAHRRVRADRVRAVKVVLAAVRLAAFARREEQYAGAHGQVERLALGKAKGVDRAVVVVLLLRKQRQREP
mmetsp:Transcript_36062/g.116089  ORF Transcript_36062/g.116089 Transcript_36062/m.116089 type:complete len:282 (-) Transcript_36062:117-962(-)